MKQDTFVVVPWAREEQIESFLKAWNVGATEPWLVLQRDALAHIGKRQGCGTTKNKGVLEALSRGAEIVMILDDDCFPIYAGGSLRHIAECHEQALRPQPVEMFEAVTEPPSRGTPYMRRHIDMPVAASMGFWLEIGDYCAARQLVYGATREMEFKRKTMFGRYFPLCGMNIAFKPREWQQWCDFIDVPRFDDIWMGWLWQKHAYALGYCFNLGGPLVRHSRQSNVWKNIKDEAQYLEENEILWQRIAESKTWSNYDALRALLPV